MALNSKCSSLADPNRFKPIQDMHIFSPDCMVAVDDSFTLSNEFLLITDPICLGKIINATNDPSASYVRSHGVTVTNYAGQASCPVLWCNPHLLLPLSVSLKEKFMAPANTETLAEKISCHSGTLLFLPLGEDIPRSLHDQVKKVCTDQNGVKIRLEAGIYRVFYEQLEAPQGSQEELYRNIVAQKQ